MMLGNIAIAGDGASCPRRASRSAIGPRTLDDDWGHGASYVGGRRSRRHQAAERQRSARQAGL
jgi:hypothetical protein